MALERYRDPEENVDDRLKDLLARMSPAEKLAQLRATPFFEQAISEPDTDTASGETSIENEASFEDGVGFIDISGKAIASSESTPRVQSAQDVAAQINEIQHYLVNNTRLGIPALIHLGIHSSSDLADYGGVRFPDGIGLAATFSPSLARGMAREIRDQLRAIGVRLAHSPLIDIGRDPRWQRIESSIGEDPYLAGRMAVSIVRGLQGEALQEGVAAIAKHFVGYGLSVGGLTHAPVHLGRRQLREIFAEPFAAAIRDADLACVMSAPNTIDGMPASASHSLLTELLREDLGFDGLVVSDDQALGLLVSQHGVAANAADAAVRALAAGMDVELPSSECFAQPLAQCVSNDDIDMKLVNRAVRRVLRLKIKLGLFEEPMVDAARAAASFNTPHQTDLARSLASASMALLKNSAATLPLNAVGRISLIGPAAGSATEFGWSPRHGVEARAGSTATVRYAKGCELHKADEKLLADALALARESDTVVLVLGGGRSAQSADSSSQSLLDLPAAQLELLDALLQTLAETQGRIVCVVTGGRLYALEAVAERVDALLLAWSPGEQGGAALADLLFGDVSPSGRLPVTLVRHVGQVPAYYNRKAGGRDNAEVNPLFPFGFGLSYSSFDYCNLTCPESVDTHGVLRIAFELTNTGDCDADEVVQIYGRDKVAGVARPVLQLIGFNRVSVPAGETVTCKFRIDLSQFAYFDEAMEFLVEPGEVDIMIGSSSSNLKLSQTVRLTGDRRVLSQRQIVATQAT